MSGVCPKDYVEPSIFPPNPNQGVILKDEHGEYIEEFIMMPPFPMGEVKKIKVYKQPCGHFQFPSVYPDKNGRMQCTSCSNLNPPPSRPCPTYETPWLERVLRKIGIL